MHTLRYDRVCVCVVFRRRWMHVGPAPKEWAKVQSGRFCGSLYIVVTKQQISPTGDRFWPPGVRKTSTYRPRSGRLPDLKLAMSGNRPPIVRQPSTWWTTSGRLPDDFRTLLRRRRARPNCEVGVGAGRLRPQRLAIGMAIRRFCRSTTAKQADTDERTRQGRQRTRHRNV